MPLQMSQKSKDKLFQIIFDHVDHTLSAQYEGGDAAPEKVWIHCETCNKPIIDVDAES